MPDNRQSHWLTIKSVVCPALKPQIEIVPLKDESGVVDAVHIKEYNESVSGKKVLGKYLCELIVDILEKGSVIGVYGVLSEEQWMLQAKCLTKCDVLKLSKKQLDYFRGEMEELNAEV